ncbi:MAG: NAD(P)-dependent oxidoreductase [Polyangiaceae bacterium]
MRGARDQDRGVRAVVLSSADVYAQFGRLNGVSSDAAIRATLDEHAPPSPPFPFRTVGPHEGGPDYDKKDVEAVFRALPRTTGAPAVVLRLPIVYGPRDPKRRFGPLVDALDGGLTRLPVAGGASLRLSHVDVEDAAQAIVLAATSPELAAIDHVLNVGEAAVPTMGERALAIARVMGRPLALEETHEPLPPEWGLFGRFPCDVVLDTHRIRSVLGYAEADSAERSLARLVAALRKSR